ncbi:hypothetical protein [Bradyrhizobium guangzhouense]|uniref:hypothetical protein n=1 Tax=Bradyrhizobium guangzhouense TaxID=1325095 RepID=UPI0013E8B1C6|nr:hypothetical protein [Bradyrhizobium guangzhouense]
MTREFRAAHRFSITRLYRTKGVIAWLDRAIQYAETAAIEPRGRGVLDAPLSRSMTARMTREFRAADRFSITRLYRTKGVIARLDRAIQYAETAVIEPRGRGVLDAPPSRSMTARMTREFRAAHCFSTTRLDRTKGVIARLDRAIQYAATAAIEPRGRSVRDAPPSRSMTARMTREFRAAHRFSITRLCTARPK